MSLKRLSFLFSLAFIIINCSAEDANSISQINDSLGEIEEPVDGGSPEASINNFSHPEADEDFSVLPDGNDISDIKVRGQRLTLIKGNGSSFNSTAMGKYQKLKADSQADPNHKVHWSFMDFDKHKIIAQSAASGRKIFGASSSKIFVAATFLDKQNGDYSNSQMQVMADMLVVSSNSAWTSLQKDIGDGSADKGRELNWDFTQRMGYPQTRGWQGYWDDIHGNELVPDESVEMLYDTYTGGYPGAEVLWKLLYTSRTGATKGKKYIPSDIYVGGKTGTYDGPTENPATGEQYNVRMRNHILTFNIKGRQYGLAVFANDGSNESVALLAGGLIREYAGVAVH